MLRIMMLLANARSDVMFAHYAVRRNIIHAVNITAEGNITCPGGQTSFSVNAPLRASRYRCPFVFDCELWLEDIRCLASMVYNFLGMDDIHGLCRDLERKSCNLQDVML